MVVFLRIQPGQVPEELQPEGLDPFRDWQAACNAPNRLICSVSGVRDPKDFPQTPGQVLQYSNRRLLSYCDDTDAAAAG